MRTLISLVLVFFDLSAASICGQSENNEPAISIVYANSWPPISVGDDDNVRGILPSLIEEIIYNRMGVKVKHLGQPWARAQRSVENGDVDAFIATATADRLEFSNRSKTEVLYIPFRAFIRDSSILETEFLSATHISRLTEFVFCDVLGNSWARNFYQEQKIDFVRTPAIENCLQMMALGRVDVIIHASPVVELGVKNLMLGNKIKMLPMEYPDSPHFPILLSKKSKFGADFLAQFDEVVSEMQSGPEFNTLVESITRESIKKELNSEAHTN
jgi:polar amino acid transport system substrate-binding protein